MNGDQMRWLVTLDLPHEDQPHSHIDVGTPLEAARVVRAARESTGLPIAYSIASYEQEWRCADCSAWRLELGSKFVTCLDGGPLPMRLGDVLHEHQ